MCNNVHIKESTGNYLEKLEYHVYCIMGHFQKYCTFIFEIHNYFTEGENMFGKDILKISNPPPKESNGLSMIFVLVSENKYQAFM
jgi:hypothetical protein